MILGELKGILDDWCKIKVVENNGEGKEYNLTTKTKVDYFNEHSTDEVTFITQNKNKITVWTERR